MPRARTGSTCTSTSSGGPSRTSCSASSTRARHAVVGTINDWWADSSKPEHRGPRLYWPVNLKRIRVEGFVLWDFDHLYEPYMRQLQRWWQEGKLRSREHIVEGIDAAPQGLLDLFEGKNFGKALCRVADDPFG